MCTHPAFPRTEFVFAFVSFFFFREIQTVGEGRKYQASLAFFSLASRQLGTGKGIGYPS